MRTGQERGFYYSRVGNPTVAVVEQRLAALDGGVAAVGVSSGMTAIAYTLLALAKGSKGNIIAPSSIYGATEELLNGFLPDYGIETRFVTDRSNPEAYEELIDDETKAVYIESISNPNVEIYDIDAIAEASHRHGVPLLVDNTIATPYLLRPFEHGADINVYSATKAISGHGNVIGGFIVEKGGFSYDERKFPFLHRKQYIFRDENNQGRSPVDLFPYAPLGVAIRASFLAGLGGQLSPFDVYLIQNGLDTIAERLDKETANARKLVAYLKGSGHVGKVNYATDADSPFHDVAARLLPLSAGGLLSFELKGDADQFAALVASLNVFSYHTNIGDVRSLITNVPDTSHVELDPKHLEKASIRATSCASPPASNAPRTSSPTSNMASRPPSTKTSKEFLRMTKQYDYASFYPGQPFPYEQAETPSDYLKTALAAERYIASRQLEDADGVYWQEDGQSAYDISLFKGASGIAFFYLELHKATGEQRFADIARSAVLRISRFWRNAADKPVILFPGDIRFGLQLGVPGEGSILALAYKAFKEPEIERALRDIVAFLAENAKRDDEGGAYWNDNGLPISDGGAVLFLARFLEIFDDADAKKLAVDAGEHILRSGREVGAGLSFDKPEPPAGDFGPNLETGTAGVAFVLEHVYRLTGDKKYLEAAEKAVTYLKTLLVPQEKGHLLPVRIEHDGTYFKGNADVHSPLGDNDPDHGELPGDYTEPICYLGQCCGPFGTGRLYYSLAQDTGDDSYLDLIKDSIDGYESLGAPEHKSAGLWGVYYCCGHASQLQFFIGLYERYHDQRWLDLARRAAAVLLGSAEKREDDFVDWPVAFLRIYPSQLTRGIGYYAGAAGIAHSLIQIYKEQHHDDTANHQPVRHHRQDRHHHRRRLRPGRLRGQGLRSRGR